MHHAIFDLETTALIKNSGMDIDKQPRIFEFYGELIEDDGTKVDELYFMCNPGVKLNPDVRRITGVTDEDLAGLPPFSSYALPVKSFFSGAGVIVAHNLSYDLAILQFEMRRCSTEFVAPGIKVCTVEATEFLCGFRLSLTDLHMHLFNQPFYGAHSAKGDTQALVKCYVELMKRGII